MKYIIVKVEEYIPSNTILILQVHSVMKSQNFFTCLSILYNKDINCFTTHGGMLVSYKLYNCCRL